MGIGLDEAPTDKDALFHLVAAIGRDDARAQQAQERSMLRQHAEITLRPGHHDHVDLLARQSPLGADELELNLLRHGGPQAVCARRLAFSTASSMLPTM